jgi:hypothetical protein
MPPSPADPAIRALVAVVRHADAAERLRSDVDAFLRAHGVDEDDRRAMTSRGDLRLRAYRALVHNRVRNTVRDYCRRTAARRGPVGLARDVSAFVAEHAIDSPYLRDVPRAFVEFTIPRWREDPEAPPFLPDLARHELLRLDVRNDPRPTRPPTGRPIDLDRPIAVESAAVVMRYAWAVHALPRDPDDRSVPDQRPCSVVAFRGPGARTRWVDCKPWVADLVEGLVAGATLRTALLGALAASSMPLDDDVLARTALVLADFSDRGLLLGGA